MKYNPSELYRACLEVAETTLWDYRNPPSHDDVKKLADEYLKEAMEFVQAYDFVAINEIPIVHAVKYLARVHALPPLRDDTFWFSKSLEVIFELCFPNTIHTRESAEIFKFIEDGINDSKSLMENEIDSAENKLGVPPPKNTLCIGRLLV